MNPKWTKVYSGPGYPIDPKKEQQRFYENLDQYQCVLVNPPVFELVSEQFEIIYDLVRCSNQDESITFDFPTNPRIVKH